MRTAVAEADRLAIIERAAQEAEALRQLREFTNSDAYKSVMADFEAIDAAYRHDQRFAAFLGCLRIGLPELSRVAGVLPVIVEDTSDGE